MRDIQFQFDSDRRRPSMNPLLRRLIIIALPLAMIIAGILFLTKSYPFNNSKNKENKKTVAVEHPVPTEPIPEITPSPDINVQALPITNQATPVETPVPLPQTPATPEDIPIPTVQSTPENIPTPPAEKKIEISTLEFDSRPLEEIVAEAKELNRKKEFGKARRLVGPVLAAGKFPLFSDGWLVLAQELSKANTGIYFSNMPFEPKKENYVVKRGDTLEKIAQMFKTSIEGIQRSNSIPENSSIIRLGETLRIYRGDWKIVVSKSNHLLLLMDGDELFKIYMVGIGKQERTPNGTFIISAKVKEPPWYSSDGKVIPFGDPANMLGTRWLALQPTGETPAHKGLGIHGTWVPETIGTSSSNGCVRMRNREVEELYAIVPRLIPVEIID